MNDEKAEQLFTDFFNKWHDTEMTDELEVQKSADIKNIIEIVPVDFFITFDFTALQEKILSDNQN